MKNQPEKFDIFPEKPQDNMSLDTLSKVVVLLAILLPLFYCICLVIGHLLNSPYTPDELQFSIIYPILKKPLKIALQGGFCPSFNEA